MELIRIEIPSPISIKYNKESKDFTINGDKVKRGETKAIRMRGVLRRNLVSVSESGILTIVSDDLTQVLQIEGGKVRRIIVEEEGEK